MVRREISHSSYLWQKYESRQRIAILFVSNIEFRLYTRLTEKSESVTHQLLDITLFNVDYVA